METNNEKKKYVKPFMEVYPIEIHNPLLQTSAKLYDETTDEQW